ncbi:IS200/IS605 family transposase [Spirosoma aerolatum]|uniref:IS200/IS605 family transposase n=1 Tax=Spirosoma aerolatum TaxID=1211326 RepID=UPI0009AD25F3|nr:IS200/IS605 family transposase [Spirosoma aerolatum]
MLHYRKTSHSTYDIKYHIVWITKYRKQVMVGKVAENVRSILREICKQNEVEILAGHVSKDHVHLFVSVPPYISVSDLVQSLKGKSSRKLLSTDKNLAKQFWGRHLWARGYFAASSGNVTDEVVKQYIDTQDLQQSSDDNFKIGEVVR